MCLCNCFLFFVVTRLDLLDTGHCSAQFAVIHGDLTSGERGLVIEELRSGKVKGVVGTSAMEMVSVS